MKIECRMAGGTADYATIADDSLTTGTQDRISGYQPQLHASPQIDALPVADGVPLSSFIYARAGQINISFTVARQHGTADAALEFITDEMLQFAVAGQWHLKITVGSAVSYLANCSITTLQPEAHSDQSSLIHYTFTGSTYTTNEPV